MVTTNALYIKKLLMQSTHRKLILNAKLNFCSSPQTTNLRVLSLTKGRKKMKQTKYIGLITVALLIANLGYAIDLNFSEALQLRSQSVYQSTGADNIAVKDAGGTFRRQGLLRLNLPSLSVGDSFSLASISLNAKTQTSQTLYVWGVNDNAPNQNWNPATDTMDDVIASGMYTAAENLESANDPNLTLLGQIAITGTGISSYSNFDFNGQAVTDWLNTDSDGDATIVLAIAENVSNGNIRSINHADAPSLSYTVVPEPATLGLIGVAGIMLFAIRRTRFIK